MYSPNFSSTPSSINFRILVSKVISFHAPINSIRLKPLSRALLTAELQTIFSQAPHAPNSVASSRVREAYDRATGKVTTAISSSTDKGNRRIPGPDDDCPICYESMHAMDAKKLTWCEECGNALHGECFEQCKKKILATRLFWTPLLKLGLLGARSCNQKNHLSCVWCRAKWILPTSGGGGAEDVSASEGYLNLGNAAGLDTTRDTSTCRCSVHHLLCLLDLFYTIDYQGPRSGRRYYGYQGYS